MDEILKRVAEGLCPVCKKPLEYSKRGEGIVITGKLVRYKETSVAICNEHPCPKSLLSEEGIYTVSE